MNKTFMVKVVFSAHKRKTVPVAGYRPHIVMDDDKHREYLGVEFYDIEVDGFDKDGYAMCLCIYENVDYQKIQTGKTFAVMEGGNKGGKGTVLNI